MLEQVTELNSIVMASSYRKIADLTPLSAPAEHDPYRQDQIGGV